jgi:hypothetical protein
MSGVRYLLIEVPGPVAEDYNLERAARVPLGGIREIADADVVIAVDPRGDARVLKSRYHAVEDCSVTTLHARPHNMA